MQTKLKIRSGEIFDPVRCKWVPLTPEERVRQSFLLFLINVKKIPASHISVEHSVVINGSIKRYDIVTYDSNLQPYLLVECKAPHVKLTQNTSEQAGRYNSMLKAPFLCITNGVELMIFHVDFESGAVELVDNF